MVLPDLVAWRQVKPLFPVRMTCNSSSLNLRSESIEIQGFQNAKSVTFRHAFGSQIGIKMARETGGVLQDFLCCFECKKQTDNPDRDFKGEPPLCAG